MATMLPRERAHPAISDRPLQGEERRGGTHGAGRHPRARGRDRGGGDLPIDTASARLRHDAWESPNRHPERQGDDRYSSGMPPAGRADGAGGDWTARMSEASTSMR